MKKAVLLPCFNEGPTIAKVIGDFRRELPDADIYVFDNNSTDGTAEIAASGGAIVVRETRQGKGNVVRSMFRQIDADIYIMADGDDTYPAGFVHELIAPIAGGSADMTLGDRHTRGRYEVENKRLFHNFGNKLVRFLINRLFNTRLKDIMSGYRAFNKTFVKNMPVLSTGFEIETEITIHALDKNYLITEIPIDFRDRPAGSFSKLNTFSDGIRVLKTIFLIFKDYRPLIFFSGIALLFFLSSLACGFPVIYEFMETGIVARIPLAVLATGLMVLATISLTSGFILDTVVRHQRENYELTRNRFEK